MTDGERKLWSELRGFKRHFGIHVRKQAPIGPYVADFAIHHYRLIIEVDGEFHFEPHRMAMDRLRDKWFAGQGYRVVRFNTGKLSETFDGRITEFLHLLGLMNATGVTSTPDPSRQGGGGPMSPHD